MSAPTGKTQRCCAEERRRQILETATQLFASQGFGGTTTRQIAELAEVNEAIIFRHFPTKDDLYRAVLEHKCDQGRGQQIVAEQVARHAPPQETLAGIAGALFRVRQKDATMGRLLLFSALERHTLAQRFFRTHMADLYDSLELYIRERIRAGDFRDVDPPLAARSFWGMVVHYFFVQELFEGKQYQDEEIDRACGTIVNVWLEGMLPREHRGRNRREKASGESREPGEKANA
jgi:AcrR family transcriptional regulator